MQEKVKCTSFETSKLTTTKIGAPKNLTFFINYSILYYMQKNRRINTAIFRKNCKNKFESQ